MATEVQTAPQVTTQATNGVVTPPRDFYKIALVASSGKGKTYSFRNMDPSTTGFINVENKPLPFKNQFKHHFKVNTYVEAYNKLIEYAKNPDIKVIVFDSFSAYVDLLLINARSTKKGFDIWSFYNEEIGKLLNLIKKVPKEVFVTAHYEILGVEGIQEKRIKVKGREWEGTIEKEFTVVLYADSKIQEGQKPQYIFHLALEGASAKCPPDIFGEDVVHIQNDSKAVLDKVVEFAA